MADATEGPVPGAAIHEDRVVPACEPWSARIQKGGRRSGRPRDFYGSLSARLGINHRYALMFRNSTRRLILA